MNTDVIIGKAQNLFMRFGIDDKLTACLVLACGTALIAHGIRNRKRVPIHTEPSGTTTLQKEGLL